MNLYEMLLNGKLNGGNSGGNDENLKLDRLYTFQATTTYFPKDECNQAQLEQLIFSYTDKINSIIVNGVTYKNPTWTLIDDGVQVGAPSIENYPFFDFSEYPFCIIQHGANSPKLYTETAGDYDFSIDFLYEITTCNLSIINNSDFNIYYDDVLGKYIEIPINTHYSIKVILINGYSVIYSIYGDVLMQGPYIQDINGYGVPVESTSGQILYDTTSGQVILQGDASITFIGYDG